MNMASVLSSPYCCGLKRLRGEWRTEDLPFDRKGLFGSFGLNIDDVLEHRHPCIRPTFYGHLPTAKLLFTRYVLYRSPDLSFEWFNVFMHNKMLNIPIFFPQPKNNTKKNFQSWM